MNKRRCVPAFFLLVLCSCSTITTQLPITESDSASDYLSEKTHAIDGQLYIGPQPASTDLQILKTAGIRRVVSFRTPGEPIDEAVRHAAGWWPLELEDVLGTELSLSTKKNTK